VEPEHAVWILSEFDGIDVLAGTAGTRADNIAHPNGDEPIEIRLSGYRIRYNGRDRRRFIVTASVRGLIHVAIWTPDRQDIALDGNLDRRLLSPDRAND